MCAGNVRKLSVQDHFLPDRHHHDIRHLRIPLARLHTDRILPDRLGTDRDINELPPFRIDRLVALEILLESSSVDNDATSLDTRLPPVSPAETNLPTIAVKRDNKVFDPIRTLFAAK